MQIGAYFWPALLPEMMRRWSLSNSEAGWITSTFYAAYMVSVPVLVTLTDRIDAKRVYLFGVGCSVLAHLPFGALADGFWSALALRALAGLGWAGTYMTGLKLLADQVDAKMMSRAVTGHAASIGISGALSYVWATFSPARSAGAPPSPARASPRPSPGSPWRSPCPARQPPARACRPAAGAVRLPPGAAQPLGHRLFAGLLRAHAGDERAARLGRGLPGLGRGQHRRGRGRFFRRRVVITALGLLGTTASVAGNEASIRFGRRRLVVHGDGCSRSPSARSSASSARRPTAIAVGLVLLYGMVIWLDSSSLTAGAAGTAEPSRRGATLAVHSMLGYAGGFVGPLAIGWTLDLAGGMSPIAWGLAFLVVAVLMALALAAFVIIRPRELVGDGGR